VCLPFKALKNVQVESNAPTRSFPRRVSLKQFEAPSEALLAGYRSAASSSTAASMSGGGVCAMAVASDTQRATEARLARKAKKLQTFQHRVKKRLQTSARAREAGRGGARGIGSRGRPLEASAQRASGRDAGGGGLGGDEGWDLGGPRRSHLAASERRSRGDERSSVRGASSSPKGANKAAAASADKAARRRLQQQQEEDAAGSEAGQFHVRQSGKARPKAHPPPTQAPDQIWGEEGGEEDGQVQHQGLEAYGNAVVSPAPVPYERGHRTLREHRSMVRRSHVLCCG